jgi:hypothetical protein
MMEAGKAGAGNGPRADTRHCQPLPAMTRTSLYRRVLVGALVAVVLAGVSLAASAALSPSGQAAAQQGQGGRYVALSSARLLNTRVTIPERPAAPWPATRASTSRWQARQVSRPPARSARP